MKKKSSVVKFMTIGNVQATIFKNKNGNGFWYQTKITSTYKDSDDEFQVSSSFDDMQLLAVGQLAIRAEQVIARQKELDRKRKMEAKKKEKAAENGAPAAPAASAPPVQDAQAFVEDDDDEVPF